MQTIHAFPRKKPHTVEVEGKKYAFKENEHGHFVANVDDEHAKVLLKITDHYELYGPGPAETDPEGGEADVKYVISCGDETVDLRTLDKDALLKFAADNDIQVHPNSKAETIRDRIVKELTLPA